LLLIQTKFQFKRVERLGKILASLAARNYSYNAKEKTPQFKRTKSFVRFSNRILNIDGKISWARRGIRAKLRLINGELLQLGWAA
jgi:hypothetical protein